MANRLDLHEKLKLAPNIVEAYYQPPESIKMVYPCIVYSFSGIDSRHADDKIYKSINQYQITVIDYDPDSDIPNWILSHFEMCRFDRSYVSDNLNHFVLNLYY